MARLCEKCPGATSCTVIPGRVVSLKTSSQSSISPAGQDSSGGVMWYHEGPSCSPGAFAHIIAAHSAVNLYQFPFHDFPISSGMLENIDIRVPKGSFFDARTATK